MNDIHGYAGYVNDKETDANYVNARNYMSSLGRFMAKDVLRADSFNRYLYVLNNSVNFVDLSGLSANPLRNNSFWSNIRSIGYNGSKYYSISEIMEKLDTKFTRSDY